MANNEFTESAVIDEILEETMQVVKATFSDDKLIVERKDNFYHVYVEGSALECRLAVPKLQEAIRECLCSVMKDKKEIVQSVAHNIVLAINEYLDFEKTKLLTETLDVRKFKSVKNRIFPRLFSRKEIEERNHDPNVPMRVHCIPPTFPAPDIVIGYSINLGDNRTITITEEMLEKWNVSPDKIFQVALRNMEDHLTLRTLSYSGFHEVDLKEDLPETKELVGEAGFFIATIQDYAYGSAVLVSIKPILEKLAENSPNDLSFVLFPSSTAEILIYPGEPGKVFNADDIASFRKMHEEIQADNSLVAEDIRLTDAFFLYRAGDDRLLSPEEYMERHDYENDEYTK